MTDRSVLKNLFNENLIGAVGKKLGRNFVQLREEDAGAKLRNITIFDVSTDSVLVNLDKSNPPNSLFKKSKGMRKRCDYVLVTTVNQEQYLLFIELKSGKISRDVEKQFKGAECVIDYCSATLSRFHDAENLFEGYKKRFICFYKPSISKKSTRPKLRMNHSTPDKMWKYPNPINPSIKQLV